MEFVNEISHHLFDVDARNIHGDSDVGANRCEFCGSIIHCLLHTDCCVGDGEDRRVQVVDDSLNLLQWSK